MLIDRSGEPRHPRRAHIAVLLATIAVECALSERIGWTAALLAFLFFGAVATILASTDAQTRRLPNALLLPVYPIGGALLILASTIDTTWTPLLRALLATVALSALYLVLAAAAPRGLGFGDVKFAGLIGGYLGWVRWRTLDLGALLGFVLAGIVASALLMTQVQRSSRIPFAPFMLAGALIAILARGTVRNFVYRA